MNIYDHILLNGAVGKQLSFVLDTETTQRAPKPLFSADPFYHDNKMLLIEARSLAGSSPHIAIDPTDTSTYLEYFNTLTTKYNRDLLFIGHNLKFDLHYMRREGLNMRRIVAFDTQIAVYLLMNMNTQMPSLEDSIECMHTLLGVGAPPTKMTTKIQSVADMIHIGKIEEVSMIDLKNYLSRDIDLTLYLYGMIEDYLARHPEKRGLLNIQMRAMLAIQEMEYNGIPINSKTLEVDTCATQTLFNAKEVELEALLPFVLREEGQPAAMPRFNSGEISLDSNNTLNVICNSRGTIKVTRREMKSNGKIGLVTKNYMGLLGNSGTGIRELHPFTAADVETLVKKGHKNEQVHMYLSLVAKYREYAKTLNTFLEPYKEIMSAMGEDILHPTINQTIAATGRTSCSKPNAQQIPQGIRHIIQKIPGYILSADYSQIELCALAHRVGPGMLRNDIRDGVDIHTVIGEEAHGIGTMTKEQRTKIKNVVFGYFYGGGFKTLSEQSGLSPSLVKKIIVILENRYPEIVAYYEAVDKDKKWKGSTTMVEGTGLRNFEYTDTETHRTYIMGETWSPKYAKIVAPRTKLRNYPIQGLATGDWVPAWLALLLTYQRWYDKTDLLKTYKAIMVVHDETVGYVEQEFAEVEKIGKVIALVGEQLLPELYEKWTGVPIAVPLKVNVQVKIHW